MAQEPKKINRHLDSLREKARTHKIIMLGDHTGVDQYGVISGTSGDKYTVQVHADNRMFCNCNYAIKRGTDLETGEVFPVTCSHTIAVFEFIALGQRRLTTLHPSTEAVQRQHRPAVDAGDGVVLVTRRGHYKQTSFLDILSKEGGKRAKRSK
jgi:hypothetical protein